MPYHRFDGYLSELGLYLGVLVKRTQSPEETVAVIRSLWQLFQQPPSKHSSLESFYVQPPPRTDLLFRRPTFLRRVAKEIDGVGWDKSIEVERRFRSVREMANAPKSEWLKIPGIGEKTANRAVQELSAGLSEVPASVVAKIAKSSKGVRSK
jgi:ERCC4-type nuclease